MEFEYVNEFYITQFSLDIRRKTNGTSIIAERGNIDGIHITQEVYSIK